MQEMWVWSRGWENPLEKKKAAQSSIVAWEILWTEQPGGLRYIGSQGVRLDLVTKQQQGSVIWEAVASVFHKRDYFWV